MQKITNNNAWETLSQVYNTCSPTNIAKKCASSRIVQKAKSVFDNYAPRKSKRRFMYTKVMPAAGVVLVVGYGMMKVAHHGISQLPKGAEHVQIHENSNIGILEDALIGAALTAMCGGGCLLVYLITEYAKFEFQRWQKEEVRVIDLEKGAINKRNF